MSDFEELFRRTLDRHRLGFLDEAETAYRGLAAARPFQANLPYLIGLIALQLGRAAEARTSLRRAISLEPRAEDAWLVFAAAGGGQLHAIGRRLLALASIDAGLPSLPDGDPSSRRDLARDPGSAPAWHRRMREQLRVFSGARALVAARRAASLSSALPRLSLHPLVAVAANEAPVGPVRIALSDGEVPISPYRARLAGATVTGDFLVVDACGGALVRGLVPDPNDPQRLTRGVAAIGPGHAIFRRGRATEVPKAALLGGSRNYYHWLLDHLPRLALLAFEPERPFVVNGDLAAFQIEMLAHLGIGHDRLIGLEAGDWLRVDDLVVASLLSHRSLVHPEAIAWLRRSFLPRKPAADAPRRVFVSRRKAEKRRLLDEGSVIAALLMNGFIVVEAEDLSVREQVTLFAGAEIIVAPHGAALANLVFATPGAHVVEIDADGSHRTFYPALAALGGLRYTRISGRASSPHDLQDSDIELGRAGIERLRRVIGL